ncbi:polysaccharide lyase family 8 super-sandwich domain-containing protein [Pontiella sulfatireligans]|uniref:Chondroitin sulfate ABC exolyase n=1 Tax=Pontiella sulfatireligans TaxID=2750658 RepID=A0A6C2USV8_9BACT|nr:polysaccharide lyase family 8 super-sandwich domain-containing protein [Pontiella sulfatireligans]VGO22334.1 Chondroitin sulfate ABC exolyase [Pontiella sulfatireligans]
MKWALVLVAGLLATADAGTISVRYEQLLVGNAPDYSNPVLAAAWKTMRAEMDDAHASAEKIRAHPSSGQYAIAGMPKESQNELRKVFDVLPLLAMSYRIEGVDNPHYQSAETLKLATALLDLLNEKGFKPGFELGIDVDEAHTAMETLGFFGFGGTLYNQLDGYPATLFLLRDELKKNGRFAREMKTLEWCNRLFLPETGNAVPGDRFSGYNSDGFRKLTRLYFPYALMLNDADTMAHWRMMLAKGLEIAPGFADTFKPDGTGYHHKGVYVGAYSPSTFIDAAVMKWLLDGTEYAYTETETETVLNAYRAMRIMSSTYDTVQGTGGRFPSNSSPILEMLTGYALLGTPETDAMFSRLWKPARLATDEFFLKRVPKRGIGAFELMVEKGAQHIKPEAAPEGFWTFPYGGLAVHRRDGWMACVKGQSKYIWNYESSSSQNLYGYHGSSAALTILTDSRNASGYAQDGWDWEHIPGATAPVLGMDKSKSAERQLTASGFMGGVSLDGRCGLFAVHHQFVPDKKQYKSNDGKYPMGEGWLEARKSYFFFDDEIVALGSGISAKNDTGEVHTTLFQTAVEEAPERIGDKKLLSDGVGNFYFVPNIGSLKSSHGMQKSKTDRGNPSSGTYAVAWFDHGNTPENDGYEYAVLVQATAERAAFYVDQPSYRVLKKDNRAHIVSHPKKGIVGYALFEAGLVEDTTLVEVDKPGLVMLRKEKDGLTVSVCNPDFGRVPPGGQFSIEEAKALPLLYADSTPQPIRITLRGKWKPESGSVVKVVESSASKTTLEFPCIDAQSVQTGLESF